ncbi:NAD(P)-dependent oxidoreductase [Chelativorans sp. AA-79]|uniref:NAD-dependent epimerase/dehydratase family protein n=1 Tax=Chelativorans sp. AA-79 TaxID=3028735 RepID=UPI0023F9A981|nr:NAD(P)-dependent oxidoreductase [Chelativorans sp. AA-79]WEX11179.1 NAD(P)-dependent oxidoreductase [Chelativorans sp. AA-79]
MSTPRTVVSGGTGYVGRFIVESLLAAGHDVTVIGRRPPADGFFSKPVHFASLSLEPEAITSAPFEGVDFFVHGAFDHEPGKYRGGEGNNPQGFRRRNLDGSAALFAAAKTVGVRRTVFLSSRAVYGSHSPGVWFSETVEARPDTLYGEVKLGAEQALSALRGPGFQGVSLRVTGVYGPGGPGRPHKWTGLVADYLAGREIAPRAGTEVHGRDVAAAVRLVLELPTPDDVILNVSDLLVDRRDILAIVKRELGSSHPLPEAADKGAVNAMRTDRLAALGWRPGGRKLLEESILELLESCNVSVRRPSG